LSLGETDELLALDSIEPSTHVIRSGISDQVR
jgi:hypothetical protein